MSETQITIIAALWAFALVPPALSFLLPFRFKFAARASLISFFPGLIGGLAFAGVWVGVIHIFGGTGNMSFFEIAQTYWDHLAFIAASGPAVAMICVTVMFIQFSQGEPPPKE